MKISLSCIIFLSYLLSLTPLYAGTQTLSTYYPAPQGNYLNMTVNKFLTLPSGTGCSTQATGIVAIANNAGVLEICDSSGTNFLTKNSLWANGGSFIYPADAALGENVSIGATTNPGNTLYVSGTADITGATALGTTSADTITLNGAATLGSTLGVAGAANLSSTLGVAGNTSVGGTLGVTGAATLNSGVTVTGAIANLNDGASVSGGNLTLYNGTLSIQYWNGSASKPLEVAVGSDGNYYATYAP